MRRSRWKHGCTLGIALAMIGCSQDGDDSEGRGLEAGAPDAAWQVDAGQVLIPPALDAALDASYLPEAAVLADATLPPHDASALDASHDAASAEAGLPDAAMSSGETGRLVGITAAHNMVRAMVQTNTPLPALEWSPTLAAYAQQWADMQATTACAAPSHRSGAELQQKKYGENLAVFGGIGAGPNISSAEQAVQSWAGEVSCWTYGTISGLGQQGTEKCDQTCYKAMNSDGCGHYTQIVWRKSLQLGCGVATCSSGRGKEDIWICNYSPAGNFVGQAPY
jgi:hypothetical protein